MAKIELTGPMSTSIWHAKLTTLLYSTEMGVTAGLTVEVNTKMTPEKCALVPSIASENRTSICVSSFYWNSYQYLDKHPSVLPLTCRQSAVHA